jgi:hypothetical protein
MYGDHAVRIVASRIVDRYCDKNAALQVD